MQVDNLILVGIVEGDDSYVLSMKRTLQALPDFFITDIWSDPEPAWQEILHRKPDILLIDPETSRHNGIEYIRRIKSAAPRIKILVVSESASDSMIFEALKAGASGYLLKEEDPSMLVRSIRQLWRGGSPISDPVARLLVGFFNEMQNVPETLGGTLTRREQEVLYLLSEGKLYKEISVSLGIAMETTKKHVRNIYAKLRVQNKTEAINKWRLAFVPETTAMAS